MGRPDQLDAWAMLRQVGLSIAVVTLRNERCVDRRHARLGRGRARIVGRDFAQHRGFAGVAGLVGSCPVGKADLWLMRLRLVEAEIGRRG